MNNEYEYKTAVIDRRPRLQARELRKLAKDGWEVVAVRPRTALSWGSATDDATLRRLRQ